MTHLTYTDAAVYPLGAFILFCIMLFVIIMILALCVPYDPNEWHGYYGKKGFWLYVSPAYWRRPGEGHAIPNHHHQRQQPPNGYFMPVQPTPGYGRVPNAPPQQQPPQAPMPQQPRGSEAAQMKNCALGSNMQPQWSGGQNVGTSEMHEAMMSTVSIGNFFKTS